MISKLNLAANENQGWMDRFGVTLGYDDMEVFVLGGNGNTQVLAFWNGTANLTTSHYINFPKGSIIINNYDHKTYEKTAAAGTDTWIASAARS